MKRQITWLLVLVVLMATPVFAFDQAAFKTALEDLSDGISQTAYSLSEKEGSAERATYETAAAKTEKAERQVRELIAALETSDELGQALAELDAFGKRSELTAHTSGVALKALKERAAFLNLQTSGSELELGAAVSEVTSARATMAEAPQVLMSRAQRRLILVETPIAEAVISISDNGKERRVEHLNNILKRHECRILSSAIDKSGEEPQTNIYLSGKKFVLEALLRHYGGQAVNNDLKAVLVVTTGGFWAGTKSLEFTLTPSSQKPETGSLDWYKAVLEKDPFKFLAETNFSQLSQLGKMETLGGEQKLHLKNAKVDLWILPGKGTKRDAVYVTNLNIGDVYVDSH